MRETLLRISAALLLALACAGVATAQRGGRFVNPAAAGDYPDPSVIRVGRDYWATATSSEWAPEFPILHSRDLVNWRVVGSIFRDRPAWSVGNYWAPELAEHRGRFYVYYTARRKGGPLCVAVATAPRPAGPYTDHGPLVCQEVGSIDGFPVTDERGRRYLLWKEDGNSVSKPTPIWAQPLSADGTRLVGERREIMRNDQPWEKHATLPYGDLVEGPSLVRRNGWFYMFYSGNFCCARDCNYALGVARSRKLLGPWEKFSGNPIMAGNEAWKCPGHGTVVDDGRGRQFYMYHAYHPRDFVYVGRQALVDEITWGPDGWPTINAGRGPSSGTPSPHGAADLDAEYSFADEFRTARLDAGWQWPQANVPRFRVQPARGGWLDLRPSPDNSIDQLGAVFARPTTRGDYVATVALDSRGLMKTDSAGLAAYGDAENALGVSVTSGRARLWRREKKEHRELASVDVPELPRLQLRMTARAGHLYRFAVSANGRDWTEVGEELDGSYLPPWDRGVRVALVASGGIGGRFDWLRLVASPR